MLLILALSISKDILKLLSPRRTMSTNSISGKLMEGLVSCAFIKAEIESSFGNDLT